MAQREDRSQSFNNNINYNQAVVTIPPLPRFTELPEYRSFINQLLSSGVGTQLVIVTIQSFVTFMVKHYRAEHLFKVLPNDHGVTLQKLSQQQSSLSGMLTLLALGANLFLKHHTIETVSNIGLIEIVVKKKIRTTITEVDPVSSSSPWTIVNSSWDHQHALITNDERALDSEKHQQKNTIIQLKDRSEYVLPFIDLMAELDRERDYSLISNIKTFIRRYLDDDERLFELEETLQATSSETLDHLKNSNKKIASYMKDDIYWCGMLIIKFLDKIGRELIREVPNYKKVYYRMLEL